MPIVTITAEGTKIRVDAPYNSEFPSQARNLAGKWDGRSWIFDQRDLDRVKNLCLHYYGSDGVVDDVVTLRVELLEDDYVSRRPYALHGRVLAEAYGRDSGAKLGERIVLVSGGVRSGGSIVNWKTVITQGTVLLVRDFPRSQALEWVAESPWPENKFSIEAETVPVDREALSHERERLMRRVTEIDLLLCSQSEELIPA